MGAGSGGKFSMTLSDPNLGFKVTGYLKVEYLAERATVSIVQRTVVDH